MKSKLFAIALAGLAIGLLWSCQKDNDNPMQNDFPVGALPGKFSVSATKQVFFSQGNLCWDEIKDAFDFETDQYSSYLDSHFNPDHVGRFFWCEEAVYAYQSHYRDIKTTENDVFFTNATVETAKADFTVKGVTGKYRTLSEDEWAYLLIFRKMKNKCVRYTLNITYGGRMGLVIYPDDYEGSPLTSGTKYTEADFPSDCVFLPTMGYRSGHDIYNFGSRGYYWASSAHGMDNAYVMNFRSDAVFPASYYERWKGASVRLVADVE